VQSWKAIAKLESASDMANILYISVHHVLERDEVLLLTSLGHNVYSVSDLLTNPRSLADASMIDRSFSDALKREFGELPTNRNNIPERFFDAFDTVICAHDYRWIVENRSFLRGRKSDT
jgi:hypothetical protein